MDDSGSIFVVKAILLTKLEPQHLWVAVEHNGVEGIRVIDARSDGFVSTRRRMGKLVCQDEQVAAQV